MMIEMCQYWGAIECREQFRGFRRIALSFRSAGCAGVVQWTAFDERADGAQSSVGRFVDYERKHLERDRKRKRKRQYGHPQSFERKPRQSGYGRQWQYETPDQNSGSIPLSFYFSCFVIFKQIRLDLISSFSLSLFLSLSLSLSLSDGSCLSIQFTGLNE